MCAFETSIFWDIFIKTKFSFPNWPQTHYVAEDDFELLILRPPPFPHIEIIWLHLQDGLVIVLSQSQSFVHAEQVLYQLSHVPNPRKCVIII